MGKWTVDFGAQRAFASPVLVFLAGHIANGSDDLVMIVFHFEAWPQLEISLPWQIEEAKYPIICGDRQHRSGQPLSYVVPKLTVAEFPAFNMGNRLLLGSIIFHGDNLPALHDRRRLVWLTRSCRIFHRGFVWVQRVLGDDESR